MDIILKIAGMVLTTIGTLLIDKLFWMLIIIVALLYRRGSSIEQNMLGEPFPLREKVLGSMLSGLTSGLLGSFIVVFLGITIEEYLPGEQSFLQSGLLYIWVLAVLLAMLNPRYLCFSYAGGIVALMRLFTGFPNINVPGIMALIGILHLVESFLIWLDGYSNAVPVFIKKSDNSIVGGYIMNRMWPIPLVILAATVLSGDTSEMVNMPDWWPIIKQASPLAILYILQPVPVVLGYGDMALTKTPEKRCKNSAARLAAYSIILIIISALSSKIYFLQFVAALFAPIAHEALIVISKKEEEEGKPLYKAADKGIKVLYSGKGTPAYEMGIEGGDIILSINNTILDNETQLADFLSKYPTFIWLEVKKARGEIKTVEWRNYEKGIGSIGALVVPKDCSIYYELNNSEMPILRLLKRILGTKNK